MNQELEKIVGIVQAKDLTFEYIRRDEEGNVEGITTAVDNVNIDIKAGDFVAVLGHNLPVNYNLILVILQLFLCHL